MSSLRSAAPSGSDASQGARSEPERAHLTRRHFSSRSRRSPLIPGIGRATIRAQLGDLRISQVWACLRPSGGPPSIN
jgi:hypothetical protein